MTDDGTLLRILQDGDSFFPSGAVSFSWGLETLCSEGIITTEGEVESFLAGQLLYRWESFDRVIVMEAAKAADSPGRISAADLQVEAQILPEELRSGSRRNGMSLLSVHAKLGTPHARAYLDLVRAGSGRGHCAVMQGFLWGNRGISADQAALLSAHLLCVGILGAAVRIGTIGHIGAQKILSNLQPVISRSATSALAELDNVHSFMPQAEIASMRHEIAPTRFFAN
jgi:urease accessory protein